MSHKVNVWGFPDYWISTTGRIWRKDSGRELTPYRGRGGLWVTPIRRDKKTYYRLVHRLVWESFNGPIPEGFWIVLREKTGDPRKDLSLKNLELSRRFDWGRHKGDTAVGSDWAAVDAWVLEGPDSADLRTALANLERATRVAS